MDLSGNSAGLVYQEDSWRGHSLKESRQRREKRALEMGVNSEFSEGVRGKRLKLISDNGSQPTSTSFMRDMATLDIEQIFTSYNNPKGNADTERVIRTIKEEII